MIPITHIVAADSMSLDPGRIDRVVRCDRGAISSRGDAGEEGNGERSVGRSNGRNTGHARRRSGGRGGADSVVRVGSRCEGPTGRDRRDNAGNGHKIPRVPDDRHFEIS